MDSTAGSEFMILKIKISGKTTEKGWFLHKTRRANTLKDVALEILSGENPCVTVACVMEMIGIDNADTDAMAAEFDSHSVMSETIKIPSRE